MRILTELIVNSLKLKGYAPSVFDGDENSHRSHDNIQLLGCIIAITGDGYIYIKQTREAQWWEMEPELDNPDFDPTDLADDILDFINDGPDYGEWSEVDLQECSHRQPS